MLRNNPGTMRLSFANVPQGSYNLLMFHDAGQEGICGSCFAVVVTAGGSDESQNIRGTSTKPQSVCNARGVGRPPGGHGTAATPRDGRLPLLGEPGFRPGWPPYRSPPRADVCVLDFDFVAGSHCQEQLTDCAIVANVPTSTFNLTVGADGAIAVTLTMGGISCSVGCDSFCGRCNNNQGHMDLNGFILTSLQPVSTTSPTDSPARPTASPTAAPSTWYQHPGHLTNFSAAQQRITALELTVQRLAAQVGTGGVTPEAMLAQLADRDATITTLTATVDRLANRLSGLEQTSDQVREGLSRGLAAMPSLAQAAPVQACSGGGAACVPRVEASGANLTIRAPAGNVQISTSECGSIDVCSLREAVRAISDALGAIRLDE